MLFFMNESMIVKLSGGCEKSWRKQENSIKNIYGLSSHRLWDGNFPS